ncbi:hypothetical protein MKK75_19245 [Methylobacterium sp. J-030]|uniref:hypothetical protein n=1 Tax=Methylobacterium sp. J-030 TaxID=2836627 RepID=UPI001FB8EE5C|nr:hypothetical protein [Methylobacterium sp. J-030]MCJ2070899.1 hypothetical protein [Methylobacterium sp. J-030]
MTHFSEEAPASAPTGDSYTANEFLTPTGWKSEVMGQVRATAELRGHSDPFDWPNVNRALRWSHGLRARHSTLEKVLADIINIKSVSLDLIEIGIDQTIESGDGIGVNIFHDPETFPENLVPVQYSFSFDDIEGKFNNHYERLEFQARRYADHENFIPSNYIISLLVDSITAYIEDSTQAELIHSSLRSESVDDLKIAFSEKLHSTIAKIANLHKRGEKFPSTLSRDGSFVLAFEHELFSQFSIRPKFQTAFLFGLHQELRDYLSEGGSISGKWGEVVMTNLSIEILTTPRVAIVLPALDF